MRHILTALSFSALFIIGCQEETLGPANNTDSPVFMAISESLGDQSKTIMDIDRKITWSQGDQIAVFQGQNTADRFQISDETAGTNKGEFTLAGEQTSAESASGAPSTNVALYPYMEEITCSALNQTGYKIENVIIPDVQTYVENSFDNGSFIMTAATGTIKENKLKFKNALGMMKLQFKGTETIKSIKVEGNNGELLSGAATITVSSKESDPAISMAESAQAYVVLDCGAGVQLENNKATSFFICLPPVEFSKGFKVTITLSDNTVEILKTSSKNEIVRSAILAMPERVVSKMTYTAFTESDEIFANPERGFYAARSSSYPLSSSDITAKRLEGITLFHFGYYLPADSDIPESNPQDKYATTLERIAREMQMLRDGGAKCIMRFAYSNDKEQKPWDATPEQILRHIEQLTPIIQEYSDVIIAWQAGFVGIWGEWYYTDNFDYADKQDNYELRKTIVDAMLKALPTDRSVALRTPLFKKEMYAGSYSNTLNESTAFNGSELARLSCFNDCFGKSENDSGTFSGEDSREYWKNETKYVLMGGETCGVSDYCTCSASLKDMEDFHWTYLNYDYHQDVISRWKTDNCLDEIKRRLGYRLSLTDIYRTSTVFPGDKMDVKLTIQNTGFAAPMNGRGVELVLVDKADKKTVYDLEVDPRYWFAGGSYTIDTKIDIPADATEECTLYLNLPDPKLHDNPMFSIRLANEDVWNSNTGYNKLFDFSVNNGQPDPEPTPDNTQPNASGADVIFEPESNLW